MTFIKKNSEKSSNLYVLLEDIEVLAGTFKKGTIVKEIGCDAIRGSDYIDFEGNKLLETRFSSQSIVPIEEAYKLFEPKARSPRDL